MASSRHKWWTLLAVSIATFMLLLDVTVVNVALPDIQLELNASYNELRWVIDAYALTLAGAVLRSRPWYAAAIRASEVESIAAPPKP